MMSFSGTSASGRSNTFIYAGMHAWHRRLDWPYFTDFQRPAVLKQLHELYSLCCGLATAKT